MKSILPLLTVLLVFGSCTTAYKSGQTPDDVYFSPAREREEYVEVQKDEDRSYRRDEGKSYRRTEDDFYTYNDDRYLRMKIRNRDRWSYLDDYYRDPHAYSYTNKYYYNEYGYSNPRSYWNSYYNPYGGQVIVVRPTTSNRPRTYNLHVFETPSEKMGSRALNNASRKSSTSSDDYTRPRSTVGNELRDIFRTSSSNNNSTSKPVSTQSQPSSSSSSSSSSTESSTAPRRKF